MKVVLCTECENCPEVALTAIQSGELTKVPV
jgi:hypothetical protein